MAFLTALARTGGATPLLGLRGVSTCQRLVSSRVSQRAWWLQFSPSSSPVQHRGVMQSTALFSQRWLSLASLSSGLSRRQLSTSPIYYADNEGKSSAQQKLHNVQPGETSTCPVLTSELKLTPHLTSALSTRLHVPTLTHTQAAVLPALLQRQDTIVKALTGTGKTLAYLIPAAEHICNYHNGPKRNAKKGAGPRVIVLVPTRELACQVEQVATNLLTFTSFSASSFYLGVSTETLMRKLDQDNCEILVCTPGRLLGELRSNALFSTRVKECVQTVVLDEADRLLEGGFRTDIEAILAHLPPPGQRHTVSVSATFSPDLLDLAARNMASGHVQVDLSTGVVPPRLEQTAMIVPDTDVVATLKTVLDSELQARDAKVMVFFNTVAMTQHMASVFGQLLRVNVGELHSRLSTSQRMKAWRRFSRRGKAVLFTSDVSARGMDYAGVGLVVQVGIAASREQFIHRSGRTARAGARGRGLIILGNSEEPFLHDLRKELKITDVSAPLAHVLRDAREAVARVTGTTSSQVDDAYTAALGFYKTQMRALGWDLPTYISFTSTLAAAMGATTTPAVPAGVARKLGLVGLPGISVAPTSNTRPVVPRSLPANSGELLPHREEPDSSSAGHGLTTSSSLPSRATADQPAKFHDEPSSSDRAPVRGRSRGSSRGR